ncbi:MAG: cell division protein FtsL [Vibrio sp.]
MQNLHIKEQSVDTGDITEPTLLTSIGRDIRKIGLLHLTLMILIFITAISVVLVTYQTRQQVNVRDQLLETRARLDGEWRNLILEENSLAEHSRVQRLATQDLDMKRPDADKEVIVNLK